jgi:hypothetical protein
MQEGKEGIVDGRVGEFGTSRRAIQDFTGALTKG